MQKNEHFSIGRIKHISDYSITLANNSILIKAITFKVKCDYKLDIGDIVLISRNGNVKLLWQKCSKDNIIFSTNNCNERCQFCPQPIEDDIFSITTIYNELLSNLSRNDINFVTITGGEPTLLGSGLTSIINSLLKKNSKALICILSNGMAFDDVDYAREIVVAGKSQTRICIAIHSDAPSIHDAITGVIGSFDRTALGLLNLQRVGADIEIRIVLSKLNTERLENIALSIIKNFPFVSHVAFMGLELHADAAKNSETVWINPPEYMESLSIAIYFLKCKNIPISIYNLPYCLVAPSLWPYLRDSISGWKKIFLPVCRSCSKKINCTGLFSTSQYQSPTIKPI